MSINKEIQKVKDVYVLYVKDDMSMLEIDQLSRSLEAAKLPGDVLILPEKVTLTHKAYLSFYDSLKFVDAGRKITRQKWLDEVEGDASKVTYLQLNEDGVLMMYHPSNDQEVYFFILAEDMQMTDYMLLGE